jgi:hypothetical protein
MNRKEDSGKKITFINKNISAGIFMKEKKQQVLISIHRSCAIVLFS